jgi:hypothetical protein
MIRCAPQPPLICNILLLPQLLLLWVLQAGPLPYKRPVVRRLGGKRCSQVPGSSMLQVRASPLSLGAPWECGCWEMRSGPEYGWATHKCTTPSGTQLILCGSQRAPAALLRTAHATNTQTHAADHTHAVCNMAWHASHDCCLHTHQQTMLHCPGTEKGAPQLRTTSSHRLPAHRLAPGAGRPLRLLHLNQRLFNPGKQVFHPHAPVVGGIPCLAAKLWSAMLPVSAKPCTTTSPVCMGGGTTSKTSPSTCPLRKRCDTTRRLAHDLVCPGRQVATCSLQRRARKRHKVLPLSPTGAPPAAPPQCNRHKCNNTSCPWVCLNCSCASLNCVGASMVGAPGLSPTSNVAGCYLCGAGLCPPLLSCLVTS